jgi:hypothetical protein
MTTDRELKIRQIMWSYAVDAAKQLGLTRRDSIDDLLEGQLIMVATPNGMNIGNVTMVYEATETSRHEKYYVNGELLYQYDYDSPVSSWGEHPTMVNHLPKEVVIYVSY